MKKEIQLSFVVLSLLFSSCKGQNKEPKKETHPYTNELIHESSPYLLQHAHNPVNWFPWVDKAFQKAKDENKLVIISIGYAACHWCHVMEHESFEDVEVAKYMNEHFVCIKVDREERPDVDQIYMTAAQLLTGSGGWPLNALALANGKPFYAGTYFPKESWLEKLAYFIDIQSKNPKALEEQAQKVTDGIHNSETITFSDEKSIATMDEINTLFNQWKPSIDFIKGGELSAPKFPMPSNWGFLLQYNYLTKNTDALKAVTIILDNMAFGGIYDQLGGGFSRYSTDVNWKAPHFEKMLYDNAQLISLYSHAYQVTKNPLYKAVVEKTLAFIESELTATNGGFYSSLDADSEGEEGKYYVWTEKEITTILGKEAQLFIDYYQVSKSGNWKKGTNILYRSIKEHRLEKKYNLTIIQIQSKIEANKIMLLKVRSKRIKPRLDDKILTSWNGLMIKGYIDAYETFGHEKYKEKALKNAKFILENVLQKNGELKRNYKNNAATINGLLDDYAFTIDAFISIYQATFDESYLSIAKELTDYSITHFFDAKSGMFFYTHNQFSNLISRKMEITDNVIPSSNSQMAKNLFQLGLFFDNEDYTSKSKQMLLNVKKDMHKNIRYYSNWGSLELLFISPPNEIAIVGENSETLRKEFTKYYLPNSLFLGAENEGTLSLLKGKLIANKTTIYVCTNKSCKAPTTNVADALKQINK
jgi:uncharacterized protein YyaL (SSP411 family)